MPARELEQAFPDNDWRAYCRTMVGGKPGEIPDEPGADRLLLALREKMEQLVQEDSEEA